MTALLLDAPAARASSPARTSSPVRPAPRAARTPTVRACSRIGRPGFRLLAPLATSVPARLYWTRRGLAVALALVALVVGLMGATLVAAFLAVSDAPPTGRAVPAAASRAATDAG